MISKWGMIISAAVALCCLMAAVLTIIVEVDVIASAIDAVFF